MATAEEYIEALSRGVHEVGVEVEQILDDVGFEIWNNIRDNATNSGNEVNSLLLPADTSGETGASLRTQVEEDAGVLRVSLVGRPGIMNIDKGNPPASETGEFANFDSFYTVIKEWAREKERRYGLQDKSINAKGVARKVWEFGGVLYRGGGGTESIRDLLPPAAEKMEQVASDAMDSIFFQQLEEIITDYEK